MKMSVWILSTTESLVNYWPKNIDYDNLKGIAYSFLYGFSQKLIILGFL